MRVPKNPKWIAFFLIVSTLVLSIARKKETAPEVTGPMGSTATVLESSTEEHKVNGRFAQPLGLARAPSSMPSSRPASVPTSAPTKAIRKTSATVSDKNSENIYLPNVRMNRIPRTKLLGEFQKFENFHRMDFPSALPELAGWSVLTQLLPILQATPEQSEDSPKNIVSFKGLKFKVGNQNASTLQQFRGPIAVILPDGKSVGMITGRISVLHKSSIDRSLFAAQHGLKLDSAPENSRAASYSLDQSNSLIDARMTLLNDSSVQIAEIELITAGVSK